MLDASPETEEYVPGKRFYLVFGGLVVGLLGLGIYVSTFYDWEEIEGGHTWLWFAGFLLLFLAGPRVLQYVLLRLLGVSPGRGKWFTNVGRSGLNSWWEMEGRRLTRRRFALVYALPALLACLVLIVYVIRFPTAVPIIYCLVPLYAINLWYTILAVRKPEGTRVEPSERGVRFHQPA